jgi:predicted Zn-dependent peptidase
MKCLLNEKLNSIRRRAPFALAFVLATLALDSQAKQARDALTADSSDITSAQEPNRFDGGISDVFHDRLANGMDVILAMRKRAPVVTVNVIYDVPPVAHSPYSPTYSRLLAALLPTLGTKHLAATMRNQLLLAADTGFDLPQVRRGSDELVLLLSIPPAALELALFVEADRMGFAADALTQAQLDAIAKKPSDPKSRKADVLESVLNGAVFEPEHPYVWSDSPSAAGSLELARVKQYMRRYLQAGNATLVITGDLDFKRVQQAVSRTFDHLRGGNRVPRELPEMLPHAQKRIEIQGNYGDQFMLAWQSPAYLTLDDARLDVLGEVLARRLRVGGSDLCPRSWVMQASRALGSRFTIGCDRDAGFNGARWESYVADTLRSLANGALSSAEVQLARDKVWTKTFERLDSPAKLAPILARQLELGRPALSVADYISQYAHVTAVELADVARRCLLRSADAAVELRHVDLAESKSPSFARETSVAPENVAEIQSPDDSFWLRPPRRTRHMSGGFIQKYSTGSMPGNVSFVHLEKFDVPTMQAKWRFLLRSGDFDPELARVAMFELGQGDDRTPSLADRLWNDFAVTFRWRVESNSLSIQLNGPQPRVEQALRAIRKALNAPHGEAAKLEKAKRAAEAYRFRSGDSLFERLDQGVACPLVRKWDRNRLNTRHERISAVGTRQIAAFWAAVASRTELDVAVISPSSADEAQKMATAIIPASWQPVTRQTEPAAAPPRIWVLDEEQTDSVDIQVIWPVANKQTDIQLAAALTGLSKAAKALGNVNAARPRNPTTQFTLDTRAFVETHGAMVTATGIELGRLETVLRELDGYFVRLVERVDFPHLARLCKHDLERGVTEWFASTSSSMSYLNDVGLGGAFGISALVYPGHTGVASRDSIAAFAKSLTLDRATIVARGPALRLEPVLRNVNHGEWIVVPPEAL